MFYAGQTADHTNNSFKNTTLDDIDSAEGNSYSDSTSSKQNALFQENIPDSDASATDNFDYENVRRNPSSSPRVDSSERNSLDATNSQAVSSDEITTSLPVHTNNISTSKQRPRSYQFPSTSIYTPLSPTVTAGNANRKSLQTDFTFSNLSPFSHDERGNHIYYNPFSHPPQSDLQHSAATVNTVPSLFLGGEVETEDISTDPPSFEIPVSPIRNATENVSQSNNSVLSDTILSSPYHDNFYEEQDIPPIFSSGGKNDMGDGRKFSSHSRSTSSAHHPTKDNTFVPTLDSRRRSYDLVVDHSYELEDFSGASKVIPSVSGGSHIRTKSRDRPISLPSEVLEEARQILQREEELKHGLHDNTMSSMTDSNLVVISPLRKGMQEDPGNVYTDTYPSNTYTMDTFNTTTTKIESEYDSAEEDFNFESDAEDTFKKNNDTTQGDDYSSESDDDDFIAPEADNLNARVTQILQKITRKTPTSEFQEVYINDRKTTKARRKNWQSNYIRTTKYNIITFLPLNLFEQFMRISNIYFLIVAIIMQIPYISPFLPPLAFAPLFFILLVNGIKDLIDDLQRYRSDLKANNRPVFVIRNGEYVKVRVRDVEVGDIVRVDINKEIPADMIFLASAREDGICYIETANLDGETNLKTKRAVTKYASIKERDQFGKLRAVVYSEQPNEHLDKFQAKIVPKPDGQPYILPTPNTNTTVVVEDATTVVPATTVVVEEEAIAVNEESLLMRGCIIRSTRYVIGVTVNVGRSTKLFKNMKDKKHKFSNLDKRMNFMMIFLLVTQQILCVTYVILSTLFQTQTGVNSFYFNPAITQNIFEFIVREYLTYFVVASSFVPVALFVTLEIVKSFQSRQMELDPNMKHGNLSAIARTSQLNQELSQIEVILSDKTGTLTDNHMAFKKCWISGLFHDEFENPGGIKKLLEDTSIHRHFRASIEEFLICIGLNHSVLPDFTPDGTDITFQGQSADEIALLKGIRANGVLVRQRVADGLELDVLGTKVHFEILEVLNFTSDRKRMSVIVKNPQGKIVLLCKGADTVIYRRTENIHMIPEMSKALNEFSKDGLRTLVFARKELDPKEFYEWHQAYKQVNLSFDAEREKKLAELANQIENRLILLGCTGIEDRLQDGVPESIDFLKKAGFQIWVLTGDKTQTAVNIAYSAKVLEKGCKEIRIRAKTKRECKQKLIRVMKYMDKHKKDNYKYSLIIDSGSLKFALKRYQKEFLQIIGSCETVVCCRVTPLQKALVTRLVEKKLGKKSLAIGDGVNDCNMIQTATVGVGIIGNEGSQASRAADYAIPRFKHLVRLLSIHGRYSYIRNADYLHLSLWKTFYLAFISLIYSIFTGFSAQTLYDSFIMSVYPSVVTALPSFVIGSYEKDLEEETLLKYPHLYKSLRGDALFNVRSFIGWFLLSIYHACAIFFPLYWISESGVLGYMHTEDVWMQGITVVHAATFLCYLKHALEKSAIPIILERADFFFIAYYMTISPKAIMLIVIMLAIALLPDVVYKYFRRWFWPREWEKILLREYNEKYYSTCLPIQKPKGKVKSATSIDVFSATETVDESTAV